MRVSSRSASLAAAGPPWSRGAPAPRAGARAGCCSRSAARPSAAGRSSSLAGAHGRRASAFAASAVPSTRARIFANAVSRVVESSSLNGEKPQSSVVPSWSTRDVAPPPRARGRGPPRASRRAGSIGATTPTKTRWSGLQVLADDLQHARAVRLAGERDVEVADLELEQARQQLRVVDVGAVRRVAVAARAGVDADALALLGGEARERQVVEVDEAVPAAAPVGSIFIASRALGEVDLHGVRALREAAPDLGLVLGAAGPR